MDKTLANIIKTLAKYPEVVEKEPDLVPDLMRLASVMFLTDNNFDALIEYCNVTDDQAKEILLNSLENIDENKLLGMFCWIRDQFVEEEVWEYPSKYVS